VGKETNHVRHQLSSVSRLAATALLVGVAVLACGRPNGATGNPAAASTPAAQHTQADQTVPTIAPTPIDEATAAPTPSDAAASSVAPAASSGAAVTPDPLDTQISNLDSLLNGVNGSLSGSDNSGGE
jgi:type IV secretory pathway VirB10-like protein